LTDVDDAGAAVAAEVGGVFLHHDVTQEEGWPAVIAAAERFGGLDIMVANAGVTIVSRAIDMSLSDWRRQFAINVDGVFLAVKHCIPAMRRAGGGGSIVMVSSAAGLLGSGVSPAYSASKGAVRLFAKSMALECAMAGDGIRVNSVHPGIIATPIWGPFDVQAVAGQVVPLGKAGEASEVADGILFLASHMSRHMTGSELVIDGGMAAGWILRPPQ
jgi:NAD(P)-dependent dehydrogenase (short-subunit alcohol dehydrogenase family)